ncbi:MAG: B-box zinc finger protein [Dehalococcoidia bacterium]
MFKQHLNWTLLIGGYFVSSVMGAIGLIVGSIIYVLSGYHLPILLIGGLSLIFMLAPYALISAWYIKGKQQSYWNLLWPLLPALFIVFLYLGGLVPAAVRTIEQNGMGLGNIGALVNIPLGLGLILLFGMAPLLTLENLTGEHMTMVNCPVHEDRIAPNNCADCGRPVCSICRENIGGRIFCRSCIETKHLALVDLSWFKRHLNWAYGIVSAIAVIMPPALMMLSVFIKLPSQSSELGFDAPWILMVLIVIACGIWALVQKGRTLWLIAAALWIFLPALVMFDQTSAEWFGDSGKWLSFFLSLYVGMVINVIILLCLSNKRYKQVTSTEDGHIVKRWYERKAQVQPEIEQEQTAPTS